jgi:nucleoside 2-deoxyribosyltransferase
MSSICVTHLISLTASQDNKITAIIDIEFSRKVEDQMYREISAYSRNGSCPICASSCFENGDRTPAYPVNPPTMIVCPTCGKFCFEFNAKQSFRDIRAKQLGHKLSFYLRSISERALGKKDNSFFPIYTYEELEKIAESRDPSVNEKLQGLLKHLAGLSEYPGQRVRFDKTHDYSVLCGKNKDEAVFYLKALEEQGLVKVDWAINDQTPCDLTSSGWQELERIEQSGAEPSNAFIAMWFDHERDKVHDAIQVAIATSGYKPIRVDKVEHVNRIDDEIIARIRQSKFLVADFTGHRNGVYFEAGFMLGLGRPVIWLCRDQDLKDVHFDTRQYNTIKYADDGLEKLKSALQYRIEAIMGKGPHVAEVLQSQQ